MAPPATIRPGMRFGRLSVIGEHIERAARGERRYAAKCDCGIVRERIHGGELSAGRVTACGPCSKEAFSEQWDHFEAFLSDMGPRPAGMTLDRIDNSKGYEPGNCRWATRREQQNNRRNNHRLELRGKTATVMEWSRESGVPYATIRERLKRRWPPERAVFEPLPAKRAA